MSQLLLYLDNCCFNRPYDDQTALTIYLETQAKLEIQNLIREKKVDLAWSTMLDYENNANIDEAICNEIFNWRKRATIIIHQSQSIIDKALDFQKVGLHNKDAIHLACAIEAKALYFITTDKGILNKNKSIKGINILNPVDFIRIMEEQNEN